MASTGSNRHAYLIMAHNNWGQLKKLLMLLDDERNDIYVHVDRKAHISRQELRDLGCAVTKSNLVWTKRIKVNWGGYSQIEAELVLLKAAVKSPHAYYHLISGVDLPLKTQDEIHSFFASQPQREYINFQTDVPAEYWIDQRIREYHFFQEAIGRRRGLNPVLLWRLETLSMNIQKKLKINRVKDQKEICKGAQWFSITHALAKYVLSKQKEIRKTFHYGVAVDELFIQTLAMNSPFAGSIDFDYKRAIDWHRGTPYTWKIEDLDQLMNSPAFWARKFNERLDNEIINAIFARLKTAG